MNTFLVMPTMRCQLKCEYCHFSWSFMGPGAYAWNGYGNTHEIDKEMTAEDLLAALAKFAPYHVEFTGGEPLLWAGFEDFVKGIPSGCRWAITSNTLLPKTRALDLTKCMSWTASWHNTDKVKFIDNLVNILERFNEVHVSQVATKENIDRVIEDAEIFAAMGIRPNILRELNPGVDWNGSPEWDRLIKYREQGWNVVEDDIPPDYTFESGFLCRGGNNYLCIMPDGKAYKCYSEAMHGNALGHIGEVSLEEHAGECFAECLGCALDHKARVNKLLLPEDIVNG